MAAQETVGANRLATGTWGRVDLLLVLALAAIVCLYWPTFRWLGSEWSTVNSIFEHGYLLAGTSVYLIYRSIRNLEPSSLRQNWLLLPVLAGLSFGWLLAYIGDVIVVQTTVLPVIALALVATVLGLGVTWQLAFAVLFIVFAMPVWESLQPLLQSITIAVASSMLEISGRPVVLEGDIVHLPGGVFRIASGCSGINFMVVGLALAALYGHFYYVTVTDKLKLVAVAALIAMMSNWVRVSSIIYIGDATNMESSLVEDHQTFGWVVFFIAMVPLYFIAGRLGRHKNADDAVRPVGGQVAPSSATWLALVASIIALSIGPVWASLSKDKYTDDDVAMLSLPVTHNDWSGPGVATGRWQPEFRGVSDEAIGRYRSGAAVVDLYSNVYLKQTQGEELVFLHNKVNGAMRIAQSKTTQATFDGTNFVEVRDIVVDDGVATHRIWFWYDIDGAIQSNDVRAKIMQVLATLKGNPEAGLVAVATQCKNDCDAAGERLQAFLISIGAQVGLNDRLEIGSNR